MVSCVTRLGNELWKRYDHNSIYTGYIQGGLGAINLDYQRINFAWTLDKTLPTHKPPKTTKKAMLPPSQASIKAPKKRKETSENTVPRISEYSS